MASTYASQTSVTPEKSRAEIERTISRFGCDSFAYGYQDHVAYVGFRSQGVLVRMQLLLPSMADCRRTEKGRTRTDVQARAAQEQEIRRRWRALALVVKAKLEAVDSGIVTFEQEWLPHIVLPGGSTVSEIVIPQLEQARSSDSLPQGISGLLGPGSGD